MRAITLHRSAALATGLLLAGCGLSYKANTQVLGLVHQGEFSAAREQVVLGASKNKTDRRYALDRLKRLTLSNAEGVPWADEGNADRMYDVLRTQGVNADKTVASVMVGGGNVRVWKGEPFEQAMAYCQIAIHDAMEGEWGNARAAAMNSLFLLRDFSEAVQKAKGAAKTPAAAPAQTGGQQAQQPMSDVATQKQQLVQASRSDGKAKSNAGDPLGVEYRAVASNFELGYLLRAVAAREIGATDDMREALATLKSFAPSLAELAARIESGGYNTVLVVDFGDGPEKFGTGYLRSITDFRPRMASDTGMLAMRWGTGSERFPWVTDLNAKTADLRWHAEEDMSRARAYIGTALAASGAAVAASSNSRGGLLAGLLMMGAGAYLMSTAQADTAYCELLPQRTYIGLATLTPGFQSVTVEVEGHDSAKLVLTGLRAPAQGTAQLRYVRLPDQPGPWATSGRVAYSNKVTGDAPGRQLPFILGGIDARPPTPDVMSIYHSAGLPNDVDSGAMVALYHAEGVLIEGIDPPFEIGRHLLEGGNCLYTPLGGTVGFVRLYGQEHAAYQPKSKEVKDLLTRMSVPAGAVSKPVAMDGVSGGDR